MTSKCEILEGNVAKIDMTIDAKEAENAYNKAFKKISQNINIAGFRKGKAPKNIVEKYVGVERIKAEAIESIFPKEFSAVVDEHKLDLALQPYIESYDFEAGKELTMVVKAELKPEVKLAKYKENTVEFEEYKNDKDALENELKTIQERFSTLETVEEDRETKADDTVVFDFEGFVGDEAIEHGAGKSYTLDLAHSNFIPGFAEGLVGHKKGEEFTIDVTFPETYHQDKLKGAKAQFKIKLHEIKTRILPELNDELAKKAGKFDTLDKLKEDIAKYLEETEKSENERRKAEAIFNKVYEDSKIDIQETMIEREIEAIKGETKQNAESHGQNFDELVEKEGKDEVNKKFREEAIKRIKNSLIIEKIAKTEDIKIAQNDILEQVGELAKLYRTTGAQIFEELRQNPGGFTVLTQQVATRKVNEILLNNNTFKAK